MIAQASDISDGSLKHFGNAVHTATDGTSPAHVDANGSPRMWPGVPTSGEGVAAEKEHSAEEDNPSREQLEAAVEAARREFELTYGQLALEQATDRNH